MSFTVVMGCDGDACALTGDNIQVLINDQIEDVATYDNIGFQKRWMTRSFTFMARNPSINVKALSDCVNQIVENNYFKSMV